MKSLDSKKLAVPRFRFGAPVQTGPFYKTDGVSAHGPGTGAFDAGGAGAPPDFGPGFADLVSVHSFTPGFDRFAAINAAREAVLAADARLPARTAVAVQALPRGAAVEMEFLLSNFE